MKKILLTIFAFSTAVSVNAQCTELFISEYVEGSGNDKAIEIYNPTNASINLSGYRLERFSNGAATSTAGGVTNLTGTIAAHDVFVIVNGQTTGTTNSPACSPALQAMSDQLDGAYPAPTYFNGNDALVLFKNSSIVDIFGMTGDAAMTTAVSWSDAFPYDGSAGKWWTLNHTLIRKPAVTTGVTVNPSPEFIVTTEWDSLPKDTWTELGKHVCTCGTLGVNELANNTSLVIYPNPTDNSFFNISSSEPIETAEVYNVMGQQVVFQKGNNYSKNLILETTFLSKGFYSVKVLFQNKKTATVKLSIQ